jgi:hypothetical protein
MEAFKIFKKARDAGILEYSGKDIEIWAKSYPTVKNDSE